MSEPSERLWNVVALLVVGSMSTYLQAQEKKQAQGVTPSLSITIKAKEPTVKVGEPIWVEATTMNESDHIIRADTTSSFDDPGGWIFRAEVQDENGTPAVKTDFYKNIDGFGSSGAMFKLIKLKPGENTKDSINIRKLYVLSRPAQYRIQLRRWDLDVKAYVKSNEITVTVTP